METPEPANNKGDADSPGSPRADERYAVHDRAGHVFVRLYYQYVPSHMEFSTHEWESGTAADTKSRRRCKKKKIENGVWTK